jgi:hypothetical protein
MLRSDVSTSIAAREYFTVDLRGLRAALAARAARDGMTESDVVRSALATSFGTSGPVLFDPARQSIADPPSTSQMKLSVRVAVSTARRLDQRLALDIERFATGRTLDRQGVKDQTRMQQTPQRDNDRSR